MTRIDGLPLEPGIPKQLVERAKWPGWVDEDEEDVRLIDFGEAFVQGSRPDTISQPPGFRPPERLLTNDFDHRLDLWCTGLTVWSLFQSLQVEPKLTIIDLYHFIWLQTVSLGWERRDYSTDERFQ